MTFSSYSEDNTMRVERTMKEVASSSKPKVTVTSTQDKESHTLQLDIASHVRHQWTYTVTNSSPDEGERTILIDHTASNELGGFKISTTESTVKSGEGFARFQLTLGPMASATLVVTEDAYPVTSSKREVSSYGGDQWDLADAISESSHEITPEHLSLLSFFRCKQLCLDALRVAGRIEDHSHQSNGTDAYEEVGVLDRSEALLDKELRNRMAAGYEAHSNVWSTLLSDSSGLCSLAHDVVTPVC